MGRRRQGQFLLPYLTMLKTTLFLLACSTTLGAQGMKTKPTAFSPVADARAIWTMNSNYVLRSAEMVPDSLYAYKPTPAVRSFGQLIAHVAGAQHMFCSIALGEKMAEEGDVEKTATTKSAIVAAMKESNAHCAKAYAMSDKASAKGVEMFGSHQSKLFVLMMNAAHDDEHYGNVVTYMRMNGMVPPSSMPQR